ncbi:MAG: hypothetical protein L0H94_14640 [Nitrospira sp.]|nr:hypothetical protein [Nitrospira sp.]
MHKTTVDNRQTHGLTTLKRAVKALGSRVLDRRTSTARALSRWRAELIADLGGVQTISTQQRAVIDLCCANKLLLDSLDVWLLQQPSLVNHRKKSVVPVLLQRTQLADALAKYLGQLGMARKARPTKTLSELLQNTPQTDPGSPTSDDLPKVCP